MNNTRYEQFGIQEESLFEKGFHVAEDCGYAASCAVIFAREYMKGYLNAVETADRALAEKLLRDNCDVEMISIITHLTEDEIRKLNEENHISEFNESIGDRGLNFECLNHSIDEIYVDCIKQLATNGNPCWEIKSSAIKNMLVYIKEFLVSAIKSVEIQKNIDPDVRGIAIALAYDQEIVEFICDILDYSSGRSYYSMADHLYWKIKSDYKQKQLK